MTKQVILGTAGHIDHGKTSLVRVLTGIDTDRLKEEKARGITIELGFAHMTLPGGVRLGIVDVPGHEKFVKHMVAGATGIDLVALVVAADEGIMPQTREHVEICELLGVRYGLVVLTKVDLVDEEWLELVEEDVRDYTAGTFLEDAEIVRFSAQTGQGADDVLRAAADVVSRVESRQSGSIFRMPLDRVFTMKGFGTVVTGTSLSGTLSVGDTVMVYPGRLTAKVRGLQVHNESVTEVGPGLRTAVNLQGLERYSVLRGQVLAPPRTLQPSRRMDIWVSHLKSNEKPLKNRVQVRFHVGTAENIGRVLLLDAEELPPGGSGPAQIILDEEAVCLAGDRFVLRSYSPVRTVAGGEILNPRPLRHKRRNERVLADLAVLREHDPVAGLRVLINSAGTDGASAAELAGIVDLSAKQIKKALDQILSNREAITFDKENGRLIGGRTFDRLKEKVVETLTEYHEKFPVRPGLGKEEFKTRIPGLDDGKLQAFVLEQLAAQGAVAVDRDIVRLASHQPSLAGDFEKIQQDLIALYKQSGITPPYFKEAAPGLPGSPAQHKEILDHLVKNGDLVKVKTDLYYHRDSLDQLWNQAREFLQQNRELTTPQFKDMTGLSRKYLIPVLEYFDTRGLTMRIGEARVLRADKNPSA
ncbi:MAG: selenocysteine-specific translation elongation factor [Proteobacteria bacterium]|nr:selenocysteine-specific translation elongation factor [Pseudomonadota bacterium]